MKRDGSSVATAATRNVCGEEESLRIALVTGGNRGIGFEICCGLLRANMCVVACCRDLERGRAAVARAQKEVGDVAGWLIPEVLDVGDPDAIVSLVDRLTISDIKIDVLVNNAAMCPAGNAEIVDHEVIVRAWYVNVLGPWLLAQAVIPNMLEAEYGRIVNVSSGSGATNEGGAPGHAAYGVTKCAINSLTMHLASSLPQSIKVNAMCPGWVRTRMGGPDAPRTPAEGAETAIWLATLEADGPTGRFFRDRELIPW